jgi:hypothetical protein
LNSLLELTAQPPAFVNSLSNSLEAPALANALANSLEEQLSISLSCTTSSHQPLKHQPL